MSEQKRFPERCTICQMYPPAHKFRTSIDRELIEREHPDLPDLSVIFMCHICTSILIGRGLFRAVPTDINVESALNILDNLYAETRAIRENRTEEMEDIRRRIERTRKEIEELGRRTQRAERRTYPSAVGRHTRRRRRREISNEEDPLGW